MVVSIVLDTEYMGVAERNKWFLKVVSNAMREDTLIVTHSYFKEHLEEVVESCADRFYDEFEMDRIPVEEINKLDICYIPDEWFDEIYDSVGSRSKQLVYLFNNNIGKIENYVEQFINEALARRGETKPDFILNSLHVFEFVRSISSHFKCPIIPWVFSAIRKVHGYSQTLYMAHIDDNLFNSAACEKLLNSPGSKDFGYSLFSKKEILALLGKKHNMPLIPLIERDGIFEVGVVGEGFHITPEIYQKDNVTDDDVYYESKKHYGTGSIITRQHPMQLDQAGIGRKHMKNDPAAFILSSKKVVTVQSQMIMKAAMWNRAPVTMSNALPYSCLLNKHIAGATPIDDYNLNFILFAYFVPNSCMFNTAYWKWRMENPSVEEIVKRHIKTILDDLAIPKDILESNNERIRMILQYRGLENHQIEQILNEKEVENVPYDYPSSCLRCKNNNGDVISIYALNHKINGLIHSSFQIPSDTVQCDFIPQFDIDGYITVQTVDIGGINIYEGGTEKYSEKNQSVLSVAVDSGCCCQFSAIWSVRPYNS